MRKIDFKFRRAVLFIGGSLFLLVNLVLNQSCAVIVGGSKYYAHVVVEGHPDAAIKYQGITRGYGSTTIKVPRKEANQLVLTVSEPGCPTVERQFLERKFRGWSFVGTLVTWTGLSVNGGPWLPIPFGVFVDGPTGSWWKPDENETGVSKTDYKNYNYSIIYRECDKSTAQKENKTESVNTVIQPVDTQNDGATKN